MKKVLFVNPFGIGDAIFTFYAIAALKASSPQTRIDFLANERTYDLARMNPQITLVYRFDRDYLRRVRSGSFFSFLGEYKRYIDWWFKERYDAMFDFSLGREFAFLGSMAFIPKRFGLDFKGRGAFLTKKRPFRGYEGRHVVETQLDVLRLAGFDDVQAPCAELPWSVPEADAKRASTLLSDARVRQWLTLAPGGGLSWGENAKFKQWSPDKFADAANAWAAKAGAGVIVLGDENERKLLEDVRRKLRVPFALACSESLGVVASLLRRSRLFLGNDGGMLHFAHSLGVRSVSIYGPVDEKVYSPYGTGTAHEALTESVECRPCYRRFKFPPCPHHGKCLVLLPVDKALESMERIA